MDLSFDYQTFTLLKTISHEKLIEHLKSSNDINLRAYEQGQVIHLDGDTCTAIEIVLDGQVVIERLLSYDHYSQNTRHPYAYKERPRL